MAVVALLLSGCSKKPEVVGLWGNTNVKEMIEFKLDNTGIIHGENVQPLTFTWQETSPHSYNLDVNFQGQKKNLKGVLQDGTLVLESSLGKEIYRKTTPD